MAETEEAIRPEAFVNTSGFLRAGSERRHLPRVDAGPPFGADEADEWAHDFLAILAADVATFGMVRMWETLTAPSRYNEVNVFRDDAAALDWLREGD